MKSKKLLLGTLSTMALVATPIAAVVSCGKGDDKIISSKKDGFVIFGNVYVPKALASKAGEVTIGTTKYKWDKALTKDLKVQQIDTNTGKEIKKVSVEAAEDSKFVMPYKGKLGVGLYGDKATIKQMFVIKWDAGWLNLNPPVEGNKVTPIGINDVNNFLEATGLKVTSVTTKEKAASGKTPASTVHTIVWGK